MNNFITLWILEIFFGAFTINGCLKFYGKVGMSNFQGVLWFISTIAFAVISGLIFS